MTQCPHCGGDLRHEALVEGRIRKFPGRYNTKRLAGEFEVSVPTMSRVLARIRARGVPLVAVRSPMGWHYEIR